MTVLTFTELQITDGWNTMFVRNWVCLGRVKGNTFTVEAGQWAPGVFAGSEGACVDIGGESCLIKSIDLENRIIKFKKVE